MVEGGICGRVPQSDVQGRELLVNASAILLIHGGAKRGRPRKWETAPQEGAGTRAQRRGVNEAKSTAKMARSLEQSESAGADCCMERRRKPSSPGTTEARRTLLQYGAETDKGMTTMARAPSARALATKRLSIDGCG